MAVGLTAPGPLAPVRGVRLAATAAGIRARGRDDLALLELAPGTQAAAVFTRNAFAAAPVTLAREFLRAASPRYLLINRLAEPVQFHAVQVPPQREHAWAPRLSDIFRPHESGSDIFRPHEEQSRALVTHGFFSRADVPAVSELYRAFFDAVTPAQTECDFLALGWGPRAGALLAEALPSYSQLTSLNLGHNKIGDEGAISIVRAVRQRDQLNGYPDHVLF